MSGFKGAHRIPPGLLESWATSLSARSSTPDYVLQSKDPWVQKALRQGPTMKQLADSLERETRETLSFAANQERSLNMTRALPTSAGHERVRGNARAKYNGRVYYQLRYGERAQLKRENPALHEKLRNEWLDDVATCEKARFQAPTSEERRRASEILVILESLPGST
jgi:hypothetical protein